MPLSLAEVCKALALETEDDRWVTARILADTLEEQGLEREADALRYLAGKQRWPLWGAWFSEEDYSHSPGSENLPHSFFLPEDIDDCWTGRRTEENGLPDALYWFVQRYVCVYLPAISGQLVQA